ncbi:MAG: hypothetical protein HZA06_01260 [Nitrospirae bacterium]|nr:hypothetical protein [Nitrospirota bacterium]
MEARGNVYGVIDNNTFNGPTSGVSISSPGADTASWNNFTYVHGGANKLYYEDNTFNVYDEVMDSVAGSRYVSRYNTFNILSSGFATLFDLHGTQGGSSETAVMGGEFYGNKVNGTVNRLLYHWGGRALAFYNKTTAGSFGITEHIYALDNASSNKPTRCGTSYGFTYNEECGTSDLLPEHSSDSYYWNNRDNSGNLITVSIGTTQTYTPGNVVMPAHDAQFWKHDSSFNGTSGMGCGTLASRPTTCTIGVGYWATNQSCSSVDDANVGAQPTTPI